MPTYEYECKSCGHNFEVFQSMSDPPLKDCPECGREVRRLIFGGAGVIFKGSGFYVTDKSKNSGRAAEMSKTAETQPSAGDAAKTDSAQQAAAQQAAGSKQSSAATERAKSSGEKAKPESKSA